MFSVTLSMSFDFSNMKNRLVIDCVALVKQGDYILCSVRLCVCVWTLCLFSWYMWIIAQMQSIDLTIKYGKFEYV